MSADRDNELIEHARNQAARIRALGGSSAAVGVDVPRVIARASERISSDWLPQYEMIREIHRGGQGVVYLALQKNTGRQVAVKVLREGPFAGRADHLRFQLEIQVLAGLRHPNIVTIYDSGSAGGFFYYVMAYIEGLPLDEYVARNSLDPRDAMSLFVKLCDAVHAAHLRGVIHRDLKPGNIRVDAAGEPHILDFGLAKLAAGGADESALTQTGQFVGSLPWSSPEQIDGRQDSIDIRTDIYALGVILYQLLTGKLPFEAAGTARQMMERIAGDAPRPLREFAVDIDGDVETIVQKCLDKDPQRRYQSASDVAADIRHHLSGEPIEAKRDSMLYVLRKNARRYRLALRVAAAFVFVIGGSTFALSVMYRNQLQLRARAEQEAQNALREQKRAEAFAADAKEKFRLASDTAAFMLEQVSGKLMQVLGTGALRKDILSKTFTRFDKLAQEQDEDPALKTKLAQTHMFLGMIATDLGQFKDATRHLTSGQALFEKLLAADPSNPVLLTGLSSCISSVGRIAERSGDKVGAQAAYQTEFEICQRLLEATPSDPAAIRKFANSCSRKADLATLRGRPQEAKKWNRRNHELRGKIAFAQPENAAYQHEYAMSWGRMAEIDRLAGDFAAAREKFGHAMEIDERLIQDEPNNAYYLINLSYSYERMAAMAEQSGDAEAHRVWAQKKFTINRKQFSTEPDNPLHRLTFASSCDRLGLLARKSRDLAAAKSLHAQALRIHRQLASTEPENVDYQGPLGTCLTQLGLIAFDESKPSEARDYLAEAAKVFEILDAKGHLSFQAVLSASDAQLHLGKMSRTAGDLARAIGHYESYAKLSQRAVELSPQPPDSAWAAAVPTAYETLVTLASQKGDAAAAAKYQELMVKARIKKPASE